ncbi:hypothetical protein ABW20_dc0103742 [Dactylellina cionopaga]|nr:hypothetical protein ABW20_dc0103742 [Dactylellina cionopaga]
MALYFDIGTGAVARPTAATTTTALLTPTDTTWLRIFRTNLSPKIKEEYWDTLADTDRTKAAVSVSFIQKYPHRAKTVADAAAISKARISAIKQGNRSVASYLQMCEDVYANTSDEDRSWFCNQVVAGIADKAEKKAIYMFWSAATATAGGWDSLRQIIINRNIIPGEELSRDMERYLAGKGIEEKETSQH